MWDYPSDCPEPRGAKYSDMAAQYIQGQHEAQSQQFLGSPNIQQLWDAVSQAVWSGIHGREIQQE